MNLEIPKLDIPKLEIPKLGLRSFSRRLFLRGVFVLLILATLALALAVLQDEKERSYQNYQSSFKKTSSEILARLSHPSGQLALLNPQRFAQYPPLKSADSSLISPLVLPFGALDFDDPFKAQQAIESSGCAQTLVDGSSICIAVGSNPYAGGFVYLAGHFSALALQGRERGQLDLSSVARARMTWQWRGQSATWVAPLELQTIDPAAAQNTQTLIGRWTAFAQSDTTNDGQMLIRESRPSRDFRGWVWQSAPCVDTNLENAESTQCKRRAFFSIRLPVESLRDAVWKQNQIEWPPADLSDLKVTMKVLSNSVKLFDSYTQKLENNSPVAQLSQSLLAGETLQIRKLSGIKSERVTTTKNYADQTLRGAEDGAEQISPWVLRVVGLLPVDTQVPSLKSVQTVNTPVGNFEVTLLGDVRAVERRISVVATRMLWLVGTMLGAIALAWFLIEVGLIARIAKLTKRAAALSYNVNAPELDKRLVQLEVNDLRGKDELGILAGGLSDLLARVKDDISREHIRAEQERQMWHAVGHEIMSPLQSLMVLHGKDDDPSRRYVQRMQQAIKVLYGQASPSEAIAKADIAHNAMNLEAFLAELSGNAHFSGIENVQFQGVGKVVMIRADAFALEDVMAHLLSNAQRFRMANSPIRISLDVTKDEAQVRVHNQGEHIPAKLMPHIFDYGVSSEKAISETQTPASRDNSHRGQGLFVVKTYLQKMGGSVLVENTFETGQTGVCFVLTLPIV